VTDTGRSLRRRVPRFTPGIGENNFAGQYQQMPSPQDGGMVKAAWFRSYAPNEPPDQFDRIVQSRDTTNKASELSDSSVCAQPGDQGQGPLSFTVVIANSCAAICPYRDKGGSCSPTERKRTVMTRTHFAEGQILFREGDPSDGVFRLLSGTVDVFRELDGDPIRLGTVGAGQFIGEMGVVENRPRSATARATSEVEVEFLNPTEFLDQIAGSPRTARELIQRLSQRLREADDRIVHDEKRSSRALAIWKDVDDQTAVSSVNNAYLAAKNPWLQRQFHTPCGLGDLPFVVGRRTVAGEGPPLWEPDLKLDDTAPFRLSRNHFIIEKRDGSYHVRDLCSTLGTIVNGEPIGDHFRTDDAPLRAGENEVIAGGVDSPFAFSVVIGSPSRT
jgi:CRP/FNR family transcriptional regulator, cyclic AMP receptor protein